MYDTHVAIEISTLKRSLEFSEWARFLLSKSSSSESYTNAWHCCITMLLKPRLVICHCCRLWVVGDPTLRVVALHATEDDWRVSKLQH
jgi:hypothetical protein